MWRHRKRQRHKAELFNAWLERLQQDPPDALIGANFAGYGGVRTHLQAIQRHSALRIGLAPPEALLQAGFKPFDFTSTFHKAFFEFPATGISVAHSHVFPWFIHWCRSHQPLGLRWIHTFHNMYFPEFSRGDLEPWQQEINEVLLGEAPHADHRITVSRWQQAYLLGQHGIATEYLPNGVDIERCRAASSQRFKSSYRLEKYLLFVGRSDPVKNPSAFVSLAGRMPERHFVMIGQELTDTALADDWGLSLPPNLSTLGALSNTDVLDAIAAAEAVIITSHREGLPTVALETMAVGRPIVVSNAAGCSEAVEGGRFGQVYELGNLDDLVKKTKWALQTDERSLRLAKERIRDEFDWRKIAISLDRLYRP